MKAADLRKSILRAAVQGKLVPQDKNDEPVSELLKRIQAEKVKLIKKGKLKKENPLPQITEDEIPYDLPEGWVWCRLCELGSFSSGKTPDMTNPLFWENGTVQWVTSKDMKSKHLADSQMKITELAREGMTVYPVGTLVMVVRSGILKRMLPVCILMMESTINQDIKAYSLFDLNMSNYIYYMLKGLETHILENYTKQVTTVDSLRFDEFSKEMLVPVPPLAEQQRIVTKLDELMELCDELEAAEKELDTLETHFAGYLPKSILQAAVQGKLVPQDKKDEPASELLKRIQAEKAKLIREGELKKEKPLSPTTEDEIPYDLPDGWAWCRINDIAQINPRNTIADDTQVSFVPMTLVSQDYLGGHQQENRLWKDVKSGFTHFAEGDVLMAKITPCFQNGKSCIAKNLKSGYGAGTTELHVLRCFEFLSQYMLIFLKSTSFLAEAAKNMTGTAGQQRVPTDYLKNFLFPLPPLTEQHRIVAKVDELLALCDELKSVGKQPIDHSNIVTFPTAAKPETVPLQMAAQGKVAEQPSKKHAAALDDLVEMMGDE